MKKIFLLITLLLNLSISLATTLPKNVQVILPYGAGSPGDLQFRHLQQYLIKKGITLHPLYRPGANGIIGMQELVKAQKDGSVITITSAGIIANAEIQLKSKIVDPLTVSGITLSVLVTNPNGKYRTLNDVETALKTGDTNFNIAYQSIGNLLIMDKYFSKLGVTTDVLRIPYKTSGESVNAVMSGNVQSTMVPMSTAGPQINDGKLLLLATIGPKSFKSIPGVVNFSTRWSDWKPVDAFVFGAPAGLSPEITQQWLSILEEYFKDSNTIEFYQKSYLVMEEFGPDFANDTIKHVAKTVTHIKQ